MRDQRGFHIERRHPKPRHFEHVVVTAAVAVHPVRVAHVDVAGMRPFARKSTARFFALAPVTFRGARTAPPQFAPLAVRNGGALDADDGPNLAGAPNAPGAIAKLAGLVRGEDLEHLRPAEAVENVDAEALLPFRADML